MSVVVHGGAAWLLLPHGRARATFDGPPVIEVEMIDQAPEVKGAPEQQPTQPPPAPQDPTPPMATAGELRQPPPPAPPRQAEAPAGPPLRMSSINLGGDPEDQEGLSVSGLNVVPPRPDATVRNRPPSYPADAVRRHAEGTVGLRVHVTESGVPGWVDVINSSGDASLDRSAKEAVALWRFRPARDKGAAVAFDYEMTIRFRMDGR